jgi:tryptophan synthase alpha chain
MSRITDAFAKARSENRAAFIPYITAGDPSLKETERFVGALAAAGADIVELGVPFTDPIADGKVNQRAAERALAAGTTLQRILTELVPALRATHPDLGLVIFSYYNPVLRLGLKEFANQAKTAGADGVLIVDLPPEEAQAHSAAAQASGLDTIFLAAPTTTPTRLERIDAASSGFIYYVSRLGVTGARAQLTETLADEIAQLREKLKNPLAVGFGISTPVQARAVAKLADAVVVGSALVKLIQDQEPEAAEAALGRLAGDIRRALVRS